MRAVPTLLAVAVAACAAAPAVSPARFANAPPVWRVDDRRDVAKPPAKKPFYRFKYHFDSHYFRALHVLDLPRPRRALGVNSLDEVPDSTWFTNRIGVRALTADEIRRGPGPESPELHRPWTIVSTKTGGTALGFLVEDSRGVKFLLKFDRPDHPELETAADAVAARLLWASGYNVPSDHVVYFRREDLHIGPKTKPEIDAATIDRTVAQVAAEPDGRIRGIASIFIAGKVLGGTPRLGVRPDDPNDRIPHELRRDQRGLASIAAWLSHTDLKEDNTLDAWQTDPADPKVHYVVHYLLDFGNALGADEALTGHLYGGYQYEIDEAAALGSILTLGLAERPWEARVPPAIRGIGLFSDRLYNPAAWKPNTPAQLPVIWADRFDKFWGAKILIRFTREQLAAAVDAARFTDPRASQYLTDVLVARQRRTARYWFQRVAPLDDVAIAGNRLCFTDLALRYALERAPTRFAIAAFDARGRALGGDVTALPDRSGRACATTALAAAADRYTIMRIASSRGQPSLFVHVAGDASGRMRVVGLYRD